MHFPAILSLVLTLTTTTATAFPQAPPAPTSSGGGTTVAKALNDITRSLHSLNGKISDWKTTGDYVSASAILTTDAQTLLAVIASATSGLTGLTATLPLGEVLEILQPANVFMREELAVVDGLVAAREGLEKAGLSGTVGQVLVGVKAEAAKLMGEVMRIFPSSAKKLGESIGRQVIAALDKGLAAYAQ
jgi:hypothetical protein